MTAKNLKQDKASMSGVIQRLLAFVTDIEDLRHILR